MSEQPPTLREWVNEHPVSAQAVIGKRYILDFVGRDRLFVLEIDGAYHDQQKDYDEIRDSLLIAAGSKSFECQMKV